MEKLETSHSLALKNKHQGKESSTFRCFLPLKKHLAPSQPFTSTSQLHLPYTDHNFILNHFQITENYKLH